ncbi:MAG: zf-HC2 domain-containing protein [Candidatus Aminicenantes bacterium]|nr:MAG: zf-HC2 domain-containing protein [Candidatus Aminicenantes bacterium]
MNCDEYKNLITISVFGELTQEELTQLKAHLRDCSKCAAIYEKSEELSDLSNQKNDIPLPDKEKSWQIICAKAIKKNGRWFEAFTLQKPVFQYLLVLLFLIVGFAAGYFIRSDGLKGSQLAQLREEIGQIREFTAASLLRQESLNRRLREIGMSIPLTQSDERPLRYLFRTLVGGTEEDLIPARSEQTSPLVDIALTLVRHINQSDLY